MLRCALWKHISRGREAVLTLRPAAVLLSATGLSWPIPFAVMVSGDMPYFIRNSRTESARCCDNFMLKSAEPVASVWPSMAKFSPGCA